MRRMSMKGLALFGVAFLVTACDGEVPVVEGIAAPTAEAGTLAVTFHSPLSDEGGVSFTLAGPDVTNVRGAEGVEVFTDESTNEIRVAAVGVGVSGVVALFDVPDVDNPAAYTVTLDEVVDESNLPRRDLAAYTLEVARH